MAMTIPPDCRPARQSAAARQNPGGQAWRQAWLRAIDAAADAFEAGMRGESPAPQARAQEEVARREKQW
jgi:hypothetical protein